MSLATISLDIINVANPCTVPWDSMAGNEEVRFCTHCRQHVYNLSEMNRADAKALVQRSEGHLCVRFYRRADGTVVTRNCQKAWRATRRVVGFLLGAASALLLVVYTNIFGPIRIRDVGPLQPVLNWIDPSLCQPKCIMGDIVLPPAALTNLPPQNSAE
jgi:hypothetical protein